MTHRNFSSQPRHSRLLRVVALAACGVALSVASTFAEEPAPASSEHRFQLFAGFEPGFLYSEQDGFEYEGGLQLGFGYAWTPRVSSEVSYTRRNGDFTEANVVDATGLYHFPTTSRWKFFAGTGFHWERAIQQSQAPPIPLAGPSVRGPEGSVVADFPTIDDHETSGLGLLVTGGVNYQFSSNYSLRFDARYVPWQLSGTLTDKDLASTLGVGVKF